MLEDEDKSVLYVESSADISVKVYSSQGRYNQDRQNKIEGTGHSTAHAGDQSFIPTFVLCGAAQGSLMIISPDGLITSCVMRRGFRMGLLPEDVLFFRAVPCFESKRHRCLACASRNSLVKSCCAYLLS